MIWKIVTVLPLLLVTGCGLGQNLIKAGTENEKYKACVLKQVEVLSASNGGGELAVERATEFVVSACKPQEDVYVVAMTDLAMTMTGSLVSREKFLEDEETTLRNDLHALAASLVSQNLYRPMTASGQNRLFRPRSSQVRSTPDNGSSSPKRLKLG